MRKTHFKGNTYLLTLLNVLLTNNEQYILTACINLCSC